MILTTVAVLLALLAWVRRRPNELDRRLSAVDVALDARPTPDMPKVAPGTAQSA